MKQSHHSTGDIQWTRVFYGQEVIENILKSIETKHMLNSHYLYRYLCRAMMAGFIIAVITVFTLRIKSQLGHIDHGVVILLASYGFSFALVMIMFTNSELLTSNFMYFTVGLYYKKTRLRQVLKIWGYCLLGNYVGATVVFVLMYGANIISPSEVQMLVDITNAKTVESTSWEIFSKAVFANFFINNAIIIAMQSKEMVAKIFVLMFGVMIFAFMGYEHVVANGVYFIGALMNDPSSLELSDIGKNLFFAFWGNYVGGGLIIGLFYAYLNDGRLNRSLSEKN